MKRHYFLIGAFLLVLTVGCDDKRLEQLNPNAVTTDSYFQNDLQIRSAVNGVYAALQSTNLVAREWFFTHDLRSDDVAAGGGQLETPRNQLLLGVHTTDNGLVSSVWTGAYRVIHRANVVIDKAAAAKALTASIATQAVGEAKFLRAWSYFELVSMWGGVPLYKTFVTGVSGSLPRSPEADVYAFIVADLKAAQEALPATYDAANQGRATKGAAQMLLARVYLQQGDYTNAKTELQKIISSGTYALVDEYSDNFIEETEFNKESIWEINFLPSGGSFNWNGDADGASAGEETVRTQEYSGIGWRNIIPSNSLLSEFEKTAKGDAKTDPRYARSFYTTGDKFNKDQNILTDEVQNGNSSLVDGKAQKVSWRKFTLMYKAGVSTTGGINQRIMRYAEALLAMAECENELGNSASAVTYLNMIRNRPSVAMPTYPTAKYPTSTKDQVFAAIVHERRVELNGEEVRNRDILRWRKQGKLTTEPFSYFQKGKHELLPIPQQEIDNNPNVGIKGQNPGY
ncbi:RagB/SusD family nutrient uptake outer membrane protein [Fibrivirga algicola]|uniref:RagB/SusD family nutrient uptake outer membrane protein n=1 Tax=Fibrivirga algicola TaxID=2950420 RepID=A0ABX0QGD2_9BACT|nr:RagB/SusD family nutrient uptake outer membrane protein [Fibrivirga algicola]ARK10055.1 carbohydrate-binding protein SusD [Fibrella sp. ES10-3-2-2]NID11485.1 RagB/SusD family nutrient uptake outer membrane protein [Fibrivirga algicola]